jgi:hypothetical protein
MSGANLHRRLRLAYVAGFSAVAVAASGLELPAGPSVGVAKAQMRDLSEGFRRLTDSLGAAETISLDNIVLDLGFAVYRMPKVDFVGTSLGRAELTKLFDATATEPLPARLGRLSAKQIVAPEIEVEQQVGPERQVTRYRNFVASDVRQGRIAAITADGATMAMKGGKSGAMSGTLGRMTLSDLDMAEAARVYAARAGAEAGALKRIYGAFTLEALDLRTDKEAEIKVARISGKDFLARPTRTSWAETMKALSAADAPDKASPAEQSKLLASIADFMGAMAVGSMEAVGIEIRDPKGKDEATGRIARIAYAGATGDRPADVRVEGLEIVAKDGKARIGAIAFTGFSFESTFEGLKDLGDKGLAEPDMAVLRKLVPTIGTMRLSGLDFDVPNEAAKGTDPGVAPKNIKFGVKDIEVTADKPVNGVPTNLRIAVNNVTFAIPGDSTEEGLRDLAALGYKAVDLSWATAMSWNEAGNELVVREIAARGAGMGSVRLRGVVGNVTKDVFDVDNAVALISLLGATAKNVDLTIENDGLFERVIAQEAEKNKTTAESLRREYGMAAAVAIPAMLGNSASAKSIGQAVAKFIAKPVRLNISARTKDAGGLGIADLASSEQPGTILDKLDVTATAE